MAGTRQERGFVLLGVLMICALIAAIVTALSRLTHEDVADTRLHLDLLKAQLHVDNGLVRAVAALANPDDALHGMFNAPQAVIELTLDGEAVTVTAEAESGKLDLNHAPLPLIRAMLEELLPHAARVERIVHTLSEARRKDESVVDIKALLTPGDRFGPLPRSIALHFTVLTGAGMPIALLAPPKLRALLHRAAPNTLPSGIRPIYTLRARLVRSKLPPLARQTVIAFSQLPATRPEHFWLSHWGPDLPG